MAKLEAMYAMRQSSTVKAGVRRGSKRCPSLPIVEEGSGEDSDVNTELLSNVAECEDEIRRIKTRFAEEKRAMQAQVSTLLISFHVTIPIQSHCFCCADR